MATDSLGGYAVYIEIPRTNTIELLGYGTTKEDAIAFTLRTLEYRGEIGQGLEEALNNAPEDNLIGVSQDFMAKLKAAVENKSLREVVDALKEIEFEVDENEIVGTLEELVHLDHYTWLPDNGVAIGGWAVVNTELENIEAFADTPLQALTDFVDDDYHIDRAINMVRTGDLELMPLSEAACEALANAQDEANLIEVDGMLVTDDEVEEEIDK